jgi:hypothetical protein|nr:MAG TPA: hypothetical protein [Caudoviricetes sp.]
MTDIDKLIQAVQEEDLNFLKKHLKKKKEKKSKEQNNE